MLIDRNDAADHDGKLRETRLRKLFARQRLVGRAEIDRAGLDLRDAAAGADRLIVDLVAGCLLVSRPPSAKALDRRR